MSDLLKKVQKATKAMGKGPYDDKKTRAAVNEATIKAMDWYEKNKHKLVEKDKEKNFTDITTEELTASFTEAVTEAIAETHALGLPTTHGDGENIYRIYPDGHKEIIGKCGELDYWEKR